MRLIFGLVLVVGLGLAGFATYMAMNQIGAYKSALAERGDAVPTTGVFVAKRSLKYGEAVTKADVRRVKWPVNAIPEGAFTEAKDLFAESGETRVVLRAMEKDEALMQIKLTEPGEDAGITSRLERGMRAFAIEVDVASGVSGFLRPGHKVDVYWTGRVIEEQNGNRSEMTKLIETNVKLIAIDQTADSDGSQTTIARTVTVAATPQQVAALAQAQSTGALSLSLVGVEDDTVAEAIQVDQRRLLGIADAAPVIQAEKEEVCTIRTRRGADVVELPIPCTTN